MSVIPTKKLNNDIEMPMIGLGTYARHAVPGQCQQAVEWAIDAGYRHIDTASSYENEEEVGRAIAVKIGSGCVKREDLFITTKLWNDKHKTEDVVPALKESLAKLNLTYVDLYLIHWPVSVTADGKDEKIDMLDTWEGMEQCVELGLARSIGVSNFNYEQIEVFNAECKIKPVCNQFELSPTMWSCMMLYTCTKCKIAPVAYTPLGLLSDARPEFAGKDTIKTDPKLGEIAEKYGKSRAQIVLRFLVQSGVAVVPKSFTKSRIEENIKIFDFELTSEEMKIMRTFNIKHRCVPATGFKHLRNYPFTEPIKLFPVAPPKAPKCGPANVLPSMCKDDGDDYE